MFLIASLSLKVNAIEIERKWEVITMKKRILLALIMIVILVCSGLTGCGNGGNAGGDESADGKIELSLWSSYSEQCNVELGKLVSKFNESSDKYYVRMEMASGIAAKLASSTPEYYPSLFMGTPNAVYEYEKSAYTKPIQGYIDADEDKWTENILSNVKASYSSSEGELIGLPVGVSVKGYMVNLDMLKAAGYTVDDLTSFEKVAQIAQTAHDKKLCEYGYIPSDGTDILDGLIYQGVDIFDGDDGYSSEVTKSLYTEGETNKALKKYTTILADLVDSGAAMKNTAGPDGGMSAFISQKTLFWKCTSSFYFAYEDVNLDFEWAFVPYMGIDENAKFKDVVLAEGTGIFIGNTGDEAEMQGAYEFIKFLGKPENQIAWCTFRGYTPYTEEALASQDWITWRDANYPSELALEEQLRTVTDGLRFPRTEITTKMITVNKEITTNIYSEPKGDLDKFIQDAADGMNSSLEIVQLRRQ